jgi:mono/diheme cytochrome c family protein
MSGIDSKTLAIAAIAIAILALGYGVITPGTEGPQGIQGVPGEAGATGPAGADGPEGPGVTADELADVVEEILGETLAESLQLPIEAYIAPRRGCTSCHVLVDPESGKYTLSYEAHERSEVRHGEDKHPDVAPDGTDISATSTAGLDTCLLCHASDPETDRGIIAPLALRDIVHPAHMTSQVFKVHYGGNCFTCHNVDGQGNFDVLGEAFAMNDKGIPEPVVSNVAVGGRLYDKWWKVAETATEPTEDQALWATQSTNTRSGSTTWRCKECHAWDYQGPEGAYSSSSSHYTGFIGMIEASALTVEEVVAILKGGENSDHDFSTVMGDEDLESLGEFIADGGVIDINPYVNSDKTINGADLDNGETLYNNVCAVCHGTDGRTIDFDENEYVSNLANGNPQEILHKIRFGQPGTAMPSSVEMGWSTEDAVDVLAYAQTLPTEPNNLVVGGQLYDKWWNAAADATEPTEDQALWATQSTNTRSGSTTWRCKECHGWDYEGVEGAYSSGSHKTGFIGVLDASSKSVAEIVAILSGGDNADHDFSTVLGDDDLAALADFLAEGGVVDVGGYINSDKTISGADTDNGNTLYDASCAVCHGSDGLSLDFGGGDGVGTLANDNPQETLHKIRFGHPGSAMPSSVGNGWTLQESIDVLAYSQTLPTE